MRILRIIVEALIMVPLVWSSYTRHTEVVIAASALLIAFALKNKGIAYDIDEKTKKGRVMKEIEYVFTSEVTIVGSTDKAVLAEIDGVEEWLPRSQIRDGNDLEKGFYEELEMAEWLAKEKGLI